MLSRWLRWLVVTPVVLFVFGAILLSCSGGSSGGGPTATKSPGFSSWSLSLLRTAPPLAQLHPDVNGDRDRSRHRRPTSTPKIPTPTLTPRPAATSTTIAPGSVPTGGTVAFNAIGTFTKKAKTKFIDITAAPFTLWTSSNNAVLQAPPSGAMGGAYTTNWRDAPASLPAVPGVSSQFVGHRRLRGRRYLPAMRATATDADCHRNVDYVAPARSRRRRARRQYFDAQCGHPDVDLRSWLRTARQNRGRRRRLDILHHPRRRAAWAGFDGQGNHASRCGRFVAGSAARRDCGRDGVRLSTCGDRSRRGNCGILKLGTARDRSRLPTMLFTRPPAATLCQSAPRVLSTGA